MTIDITQLGNPVTQHGGLIDIVAVLLSVCIALIIALYIHRTLLLIRERRKNDLQFRYQYLLYDALVETQSEGVANTFLEVATKLFQHERDKSKHLDQQILTNIILNLKRNLTGVAQEQLLDLAYALKLPDHSLKKLRNRDLSIRVQGLQEVSAMQVSDPKVREEVENLRSTNPSLQSQEIIVAMVKMGNVLDLTYLGRLTAPLSEWAQIRLHHHLRSLERHKLPGFNQWLDSKNESVVIFSLRMIAEFKQYAAGDSVLDQLSNTSSSIIVEATKTVTRLKLTEAVPTLMNLTQYSDPNVQLASLQALSALGSAKQLTKIDNLREHPDYWVRRATSEAFGSLHSGVK